ncbi:A disintegrin and metalloproteinase with thrombospondin motifs 7-like [Acipenser oxyrinchus oxyrinchus]|uniref:A disintegrin and metalloproteinase with thrombospondin motifs 7-like n=1 Tax=Acipenser oxyrinchus oxyrinchus TaxID=40147 RepID=A0AAD8G0S0_ACIOX|nr:A disintegrin and metalloproteinase with thrombospondin motifs 7-like [Acipenser oxyrinchus oxyrinchus]
MLSPRSCRSRASPFIGQTCSLFAVLSGILAGLGSCTTYGFTQGTPFEVVYPVRVDEAGQFVSHSVSRRVSRIHKRDLSSEDSSSVPVYYKLQHSGQDLLFNLSRNPYLLAPGFVSERRYGGLAGAKIRTHSHYSCQFIGEVQGQAATSGKAAISTCNGLMGVFHLSNEDFFIEPLGGEGQEDGAAQPHVIYKRHVAERGGERGSEPPRQSRVSEDPTINGTCGVKESRRSREMTEKRRVKWEQKQRRHRRIRQRSISKEKWVETLVVADTKMVEYHGSEHVEDYVLTVMNMVAGLFHDASVGNSIHIVVVRLILMEEDEEDLKITHHADNSLTSFCKWQKSLNMKGDANPTHHDVAVLLTRKDICAAMNRPCETLGLSHVSGMCQPHRSCSINEDTGLPVAFTVAHELGHNFGIQHDGSGNDCEPIGKRPFIMSPQLLYGSAPPSWSRCSREYITRFLDRGWGLCLDDPPIQDVIEFSAVPPGVLYDAAHQCRLQYGSRSVFCDDMDNVCSTLWCTVGNTCHSKLDAAVDGTKCGLNKWCFNGECVAVGYRPESINGGWGSWSSWSACTRSCGAGVQNAERQCNNPVPKYGGKYCLGERRRYKLCNTDSCQSDKPSFRHIQCRHFDTMPYKGKLYKWIPVNNRINPCELHCRPLSDYFSEKMLDAVTDGTQCYEGSVSRDMCINGICKNVGCDYEIDSNAVEDRCGVCHGNGSTCETVKKTFEESEGMGYVDIGLIPEGAREIRIEEVAEAGNFLALRSQDPERYFLNGGWTIQWNGDYKVAGTTFTYERSGNLENLTSPGPTREPVWIQLLFQETNPGVRYEYTIRRDLDNDNEIQPPEFFWLYGSWSACSASCGTGVQRQVVHCLERIAGIVEERYCDPATRPDDKQASCNEELCPARWWEGEWQKCSASCGDTGLMKRTVLCIQSVGMDEQRALQPSECQHIPRPEAIAHCNREQPCPAQWTVGNWSECSETCGGGIQRRAVGCSKNTGTDCEPREKPISETTCNPQPCPKRVDIFGSEWSGSGSSSKELFNEIDFIPNNDNYPHPVPEHVIPKSHGPDKYDDLNNLIEDDFIIHNRIEPTDDKGSSPGRNVFVDDFYYDYNFINFHEDLSYDPVVKEKGEEEENIKEKKPGVNSVGGESDQNSHLMNGIDEESLGRPKENTTSAIPEDSDATSEDSQPTLDTPYDSVLIEQENKNLLGGENDKHNEAKESPYEEQETETTKPDLADTEKEDEEIFYLINHLLPVVNHTKQYLDTAIPNSSDNEKQPNGGLAPTDSPSEVAVTEILHSSRSIIPDSTGTESYETDLTEEHIHEQSLEEADDGDDENPQEEYESEDNDFNQEGFSETDENDDVDEDVSEGLNDIIDDEEDVIDDLIFSIGEDDETGDEDIDSRNENDFSQDGMNVIEQDTAVGDSNEHVPENIELERYLTSKEPPETPLVLSDELDTPIMSSSEAIPFTSEPPITTMSNQYNLNPISVGLAFEGQDSSHYNKVGDHDYDPSDSEPDSATRRTKPTTEKIQTTAFSMLHTPESLPPIIEHPAGHGYPRHTRPESNSQPPHNRPFEEDPLDSQTDFYSTSSPPVTVTQLGFPQGEVYGVPASADDFYQKHVTAQPSQGTHKKNKALITTTTTASTTEWPEIDANEIVVPEHMLRHRYEDREHQTTDAPDSSSHTSRYHLQRNLQEPSTPALANPTEPLLSTQSANKDTSAAAFWSVSHWSACSTSCGLGAIWRTVQCSSLRDTDCDMTKKPAPARRCYLRPCSAWRVGEWGKCSSNCGGGMKVREVQCTDTRDRRPLRPFHCQAVSHKPPLQISCNSRPCMDWYTSSWSECSELCGGGEQERFVTCPEVGRCQESMQPNSTKGCNVHPCTKWVVGSWGQCTATCGGGIQRRLVKCVNTKTGNAEEDSSQCDHEPWPENTQKCNTQECNNAEPSHTCVRNRLTFGFCQTLKLLGRCPLPTVRVQCCQTCTVGGHGVRERGNERATRR